jgi:hypothetical protein
VLQQTTDLKGFLRNPFSVSTTTKFKKIKSNESKKLECFKPSLTFVCQRDSQMLDWLSSNKHSSLFVNEEEEFKIIASGITFIK